MTFGSCASAGSASSRPAIRPRPSSLPRTHIATLLRGSGATGVETHAREVADFISALGVECELVTPFSSRPWLASGAFAPRRMVEKHLPAVSVAWYRWSHLVFLQDALRRRLCDGVPVLVYAQCPVAALAALRARRTRSQRVVMVVHFHESQADEWADRRFIERGGSVFRHIRQLEEQVLPLLDGIVYVSEAAQRALEDRIPGLGRVPSAQIPNFVPGGPLRRDVRLGPPADLVTVGSLEPHKNHRFLIEVLAASAQDGRRFSLDVIGEGSLHRSLINDARTRDVGDQVRFLGRCSDVRAQLPGHLAYVHAATRESFGMAVIEAMAAGLPVFAPRVGGLPEILDDGAAGVLWTLDDPVAAARALIGTIDDTERLRRSGDAARARYAEAYSSERVAPELVRFLESVAVQ